MRKGRQIARCPHRPLLRNNGRHAFFQHRLDQGDQIHAHTGRATPKAQQFQRHHKAGLRTRNRDPHTAAMRQDQVALQGGGVLGLNLDRRQLAKAGIDAVDGGRATGRNRDTLLRHFDRRMTGRVELYGGTFAKDRFQIGKGHCPRCQRQRGHAIPPKMRVCSELKPMR